jgi:hypothetical protein
VIETEQRERVRGIGAHISSSPFLPPLTSSFLLPLPCTQAPIGSAKCARKCSKVPLIWTLTSSAPTTHLNRSRRYGSIHCLCVELISTVCGCRVQTFVWLITAICLDVVRTCITFEKNEFFFRVRRSSPVPRAQMHCPRLARHRPSPPLPLRLKHAPALPPLHLHRCPLPPPLRPPLIVCPALWTSARRFAK